MTLTRYVVPHPPPSLHQSAKKNSSFPFSLQKFGIGLFVLYFAQLSLGAIIHWIKPHNVRSRPLQNYLHAVVGLLLVALAFYQVRTGYRTEWPTQTGRGALPKTVDDIWYIWVVVSHYMILGARPRGVLKM